MGGAPRYRHFSIVLYPDSITYNYEKVLQAIQTKTKLYAWICHDRDILPDGSNKKLHTHVVLSYENDKTVSAMLKELGLHLYPEQLKNDIPINDLDGALLYLIHRRNPEKYQYNAIDIQGTYKPYIGDLLKQNKPDKWIVINEIIEFIKQNNPSFYQTWTFIYSKGYMKEYCSGSNYRVITDILKERKNIKHGI